MGVFRSTFTNLVATHAVYGPVMQATPSFTNPLERVGCGAVDPLGRIRTPKPQSSGRMEKKKMSAEGKPDVAAVTFSFVVPVHNAAESLPAYHEELRKSARKLDAACEFIFVNDGSTDQTGAVLRRLREQDDHVKYVELTRNFGRREARTCGLDYAAGAAVITTDPRCHYLPELIDELIGKWRQGYAVVYAVSGAAGPLWRRLRGKVLGWGYRKLTKLDPSDPSDFRLLSRPVVDALRAARAKTRLLGGLVEWMGFRRATVSYEGELAEGAAPEPSLSNSANLLAGAIFDLLAGPLRWIGLAGLAMAAAALLYAIGALICWPLLGTAAMANWVMLAVGVAGLQLAILGVLGEHVGRAHGQARDLPIYVVGEAVGFEAAEDERPSARESAAKVPTGQTAPIRFFT